MINRRANGFTLIELIIIILVIGIISSIALKNFGSSMESSREAATLKEMRILTEAITGDKDHIKDGMHSDFGYVGDIGSIPSDLDALYQNPGGYTTWNGPYIQEGYDKDAWGDDYIYNGGVTLISPGNGDPITRQFAQNSADLTSNTVAGIIYDGLGALPGSNSSDIDITIRYPDGTGGMTSSMINPGSSGEFLFTNLIPIGNHQLIAINTAENETTRTYISVEPAVKSYCELRFSGSYWYTLSIVPSVSTGILGHWKLDESSGTIAADASGNGNHGTLHNMNPASDWVTGKIDGALDFDGNNDYFDVPLLANSVTNLTFSVWFKSDDGGSVPNNYCAQRFISQPRSNTYSRIAFGLNNGRIGTYWHDGGHNVGIGTTVITAGIWYHAALTYDGAVIRLYLNGVEENTFNESGLTSASNNNFNIGQQISGERRYDGQLDDVRIYERALLAGEVLNIYNTGN